MCQGLMVRGVWCVDDEVRAWVVAFIAFVWLRGSNRLIDRSGRPRDGTACLSRIRLYDSMLAVLLLDVTLHCRPTTGARTEYLRLSP